MFIAKSELAPFEPPKWAWARFSAIILAIAGVVGVGWTGIYFGLAAITLGWFTILVSVIIIGTSNQTGKFLGEFWQKTFIGTVISIYCNSRTGETRHFITLAYKKCIVPGEFDADVLVEIPYNGLLARHKGQKCYVVRQSISTGTPYWEESLLKVVASLHDDNDDLLGIRVAIWFVFQGRTSFVAPEEHVLAAMAKYVASHGIFDAIHEAAVHLPKENKNLQTTVRQLEHRIDELNKEKHFLIQTCRFALQKFMDSKRTLRSDVVKEANAILVTTLPANDPVRMEVERRYGIEPEANAAS